MKLSWGVIYVFLWFYRSAVSLLAQSVVTQLTSLGDAGRYQISEFALFSLVYPTDITGFTRVLSTALTDSLGAVFRAMSGGSPALINIGFQSVAFLGIVALLAALPKRERLVVFLLVLLPSFTVWSSVASKEAIVVFAIGVFLSTVVKEIYGGRYSVILRWFSLLIILVFKIHYAPALIFVLAAPFLLKNVRQAGFLLLVGGVVSCALVFALRESLGELAISVVPHFTGMGASTREAFFVVPGDFLAKAPYGMFISFFGPTLGEAQEGILQTAAFLESAMLAVILSISFLVRLWRMPVFVFLLGVFAVSWMLFTTYPLGVMNPGSAVRYRTGYELMIFVVVFVMATRSAFLTMRYPQDTRLQAARRT